MMILIGKVKCIIWLERYGESLNHGCGYGFIIQTSVALQSVVCISLCICNFEAINSKEIVEKAF